MTEYFIFLVYFVNFSDTWKIQGKRFSWGALRGAKTGTVLKSVISL